VAKHKISEKTMREKDVEKRLVFGIKALGGEAYKFASPSRRGVADRLVVMPGGRVFFVEVKTETGKLSPSQEFFRSEITNLGGNYACVHGAADVDRFLRWVVKV
jgi:hypothetical protein